MKNDILKRALSGDELTDLNIIDCHCHLGPWYNFYFPKANIDEMIYDADIIGVDKICISPLASISTDYKLGNKQMIDAIKNYPKRVLGLLTINPYKVHEIDEEFNKYYSKRHVVGVKIHPSMHFYDVNGDGYFKVYDKVKQFGGFILSHTWDNNPKCSIEMCEDVIKYLPNVAFILGHSGGTSNGIQKAIKVVNKYENAYMDTSGYAFADTWIEEIADKCDKTKILFGSDYPFEDLRGGISRVLFADLDDDIKERILGKNFESLLLKYPKY